ncbi:MAG: 30S ribosomal protein S20 [Deltaproteobacteria bacterium]|nr:30S ribosomal protein S20 [Deltaproteobacteria bacterium]
MATHASALKRQRQNEKRRARNRTVKSALKSLIKQVKSAKSKANAAPHLQSAISRLSKAAQKGIIHKNNASRHISRLTQFVNHLS